MTFMTFTEKYMKPFEGEDKSASEVFRLGMSLAVEDLGFDNLVPLLPRKVDALKKVYEWDKDFNIIPLREWDYCANFVTPLLISRGVSAFSVSQKVSVLKEVARMLCEGRNHA